ncbi:MAG TPA: hypothetical protein VGJ29_19870 [Vicinamibacterales bacterium]|jgi:hypothetical protein
MLKKLASAIFFLDSLVIGLEAFGHGAQAGHLHTALDPFPIDPNVGSMIAILYAMGFFLVLGAVLLLSGYALAPQTTV